MGFPLTRPLFHLLSFKTSRAEAIQYRGSSFPHHLHEGKRGQPQAGKYPRFLFFKRKELRCNFLQCPSTICLKLMGSQGETPIVVFYESNNMSSLTWGQKVSVCHWASLTTVCINRKEIFFSLLKSSVELIEYVPTTLKPTCPTLLLQVSWDCKSKLAQLGLT